MTGANPGDMSLYIVEDEHTGTPYVCVEVMQEEGSGRIVVEPDAARVWAQYLLELADEAEGVH